MIDLFSISTGHLEDLLGGIIQFVIVPRQGVGNCVDISVPGRWGSTWFASAVQYPQSIGHGEQKDQAGHVGKQNACPVFVKELPAQIILFRNEPVRFVELKVKAVRSGVHGNVSANGDQIEEMVLGHWKSGVLRNIEKAI